MRPPQLGARERPSAPRHIAPPSLKAASLVPEPGEHPAGVAMAASACRYARAAGTCHTLSQTGGDDPPSKCLRLESATGFPGALSSLRAVRRGERKEAEGPRLGASAWSGPSVLLHAGHRAARCHRQAATNAPGPGPVQSVAGSAPIGEQPRCQDAKPARLSRSTGQSQPPQPWNPAGQARRSEAWENPSWPCRPHDCKRTH